MKFEGVVEYGPVGWVWAVAVDDTFIDSGDCRGQFHGIERVLSWLRSGGFIPAAMTALDVVELTYEHQDDDAGGHTLARITPKAV